MLTIGTAASTGNDDCVTLITMGNRDLVNTVCRRRASTRSSNAGYVLLENSSPKLVQNPSINKVNKKGPQGPS